MPADLLPTILEPAPELATPIEAHEVLIRPEPAIVVPALITDAGGDRAGGRYVEFFTANTNLR